MMLLIILIKSSLLSLAKFYLAKGDVPYLGLCSTVATFQPSSGRAVGLEDRCRCL